MNPISKHKAARENLRKISLPKVVDAEYLSIEDLMKYLQIGKNSAYALTKIQGFPCFMIGRQTRIPKAALDSWLSEAAAEHRKFNI